jgi:hypothetical protein
VPFSGHGTKTLQNVPPTLPCINPILVRERFHNRVYDHNFTDTFVQGNFPGQVDIPPKCTTDLALYQSRYVNLAREIPLDKSISEVVVIYAVENGTDFSDENYAASMGNMLVQRLLHSMLMWEL